MNKFLLTCLMSISFFAVNAQYTTDKDTLNVTYNAGLAEFSSEVLFTNTSGASLSTTWSFNSFTMVPTSWSFGFCDNNSCYPISISSNSNTFTLDKDSSFHLSVHISPKGVSSDIVVPVSLNGGGLRKTIYIKININATGITNEKISSINVYPNPTSDYLVIDNNMLEADGLLIYNNMGKVVLNTTVENNTNIDLSNFSNGNYIAVLTKENKKVFTKSITLAH